jgi:sec-independent protein translocase protein TatA
MPQAGATDPKRGVEMNMLAVMPGPAELIIVLVIVVIFFGVGKLPNVMGQLGKGVKSFKEGMKESDREKAQKAIDITPDSEDTEAEVTEAATEVIDEVAEG